MGNPTVSSEDTAAATIFLIRRASLGKRRTFLSSPFSALSSFCFERCFACVNVNIVCVTRKQENDAVITISERGTPTGNWAAREEKCVFS